jgi:hypothetical protein
MANQHPFESLVDNIFGLGSSKPIAKPSKQNNHVMDALGSQLDYQDFQANFKARLNRLNTYYQCHISQRDLLDQVNNISGSNTWNGAFAELSAIDFFNMKSNSFFTPPHLNIDINVSRSLASSYGMKQANLDLCFGYKNLEIFTDVKILQDVSSELFNKIYEVVWPNKANIPLIKDEYPYDSDYVPIRDNQNQIQDLIKNSINSKPTVIDCTSIVPGLKFRLDWTNNFNWSQTCYCPYRHAEQFHHLPFVHAKKFVKSNPFFLTFVIFPWFNGMINNPINSKKTFYRSLSRRVFCQYQNKRKSFKTFNTKFSTSETFSTISKYLSGILFLEDNTISSSTPNEVNVDGYFFYNPNAKHKLSGGLFDSYLHTLNIIHYDDFMNDNY